MEEDKKRVNIACFYDVTDQSKKEKLFTHFAHLDANIFSDQDIVPGTERIKEVDDHIYNADIILLLVSSDFLASDEYDVLENKIVRFQKEHLVQIVPIILRPCQWSEDTLIQKYNVLPDDYKTVQEWVDEDAAYENIRRGVQRVIKDVLSRIAQTTLEQQEKARFDPSHEIPLFKYIVASNIHDQIEHRRFIMQLFYRQSLEGKYSLSEKDVFLEIRDKGDFMYNRVTCRADLAFLEKNGNLNKTHVFKDMDNRFSEKLQVSDEFVYTASPYALEIERLIASWRYSRASSGSLDRTNLLLVQTSLHDLLEYLSRSDDFSNEFLYLVQETWDRVTQTWKNLSHAIWLYLNNLENDAQQDLYNLDAYNKYKSGVINYIERFESTLSKITPDICQLLTSWNDKEKDRLVQYLLQKHIQFGVHEDERKLSHPQLQKEVYQQITDIHNWFLIQAPQFHRRAGNEIQRIVGRAKRLSDHYSNRVRNTTHLQELANICLECGSEEEARHIFMLAFSYIQPLHLSQNVLPEPGITEESETISVWLAPALYQPILPLINREKQPAQINSTIEKPERKKTLRDLQRVALQGIANDKKLFQQLFSTLPLDLGSLTQTIIEPEFCLLLEKTIDECLSNSLDHSYSRDNAIIVLCNPGEQRYINLCTDVGVLYLPRYIFNQPAKKLE